MTDDRLLPKREVLRKVGFSNSTLWRLRKQRRFPEPVVVADQAQRWIPAEIDEWLASRIAEREAA